MWEKYRGSSLMLSSFLHQSLHHSKMVKCFKTIGEKSDLKIALDEKSGNHQSHWDSSSGNHEPKCNCEPSFGCWVISVLMTEVDSQTDQMQPTDSASPSVFIFISFGSFINDILYISQKVVNTVALRRLAVGSAHNALVGCREQHDICGLPVEVLHSYCTLVWAFWPHTTDCTLPITQESFQMNYLLQKQTDVGVEEEMHAGNTFSWLTPIHIRKQVPEAMLLFGLSFMLLLYSFYMMLLWSKHTKLAVSPGTS